MDYLVPNDGDTIVIWFSCGAASAAAAYLAIKNYPNSNVRIINTPIDEEHPDNQRFLLDCQDWLGVKIEQKNSKYGSSCNAIWESKKYFSGNKGAPCTNLLKKQARVEWEYENDWDFFVLGYTCEEENRMADIASHRADFFPVLHHFGYTKEACKLLIHRAGIKLPEIYSLGFDHANCIGCCKSTSPKYWRMVRENFPKIFEERRKLTDQIGCRPLQYRGDRYSLAEIDALGQEDSQDLFDCGVFCNSES